MDEKYFALCPAVCCQCGDAHGDSGTDKLLAAGVGLAGAFYFSLFAGCQAPSLGPCKLRHFTLLLAR
ncbi:hypothetical protein ES703_70669 [subsurface metagenome]